MNFFLNKNNYSFNKTREDFKTFKEYNDYLEQVEDISR